MNKRNNTKKQYKHLFNIIVISLVIGFVAGVLISKEDLGSIFSNNNSQIDHEPVLIGTSEVNVCFTPPKGCGKVITNLITKAKESIYVQAYGMTSNEIVDELLKAHSRGVKVRVLLDKSNLSDKHSKMRQMQKAGIDVGIDRVPGIAHNKVMIIDKHIVITGSFNFTKSADIRNAENVIIINDSKVADKYLQNWLSRKALTKAQ